MHGMYGTYPMHRDASGTSWVPDSTRMPGMHRIHNKWLFMIHGFVNTIYDHQSGPRGDKTFLSENMLMMTAQADYNHTTLGLRTMFSLEPGTIEACGYPLLLQTGETCNGITPLIDHQHPHNLFMELAAVYTLRLRDETSVFLYAGFPGEPALGPPTFMHRFSAWFNPEAPITHHWLDSTHITFGVATIGCTHNWFKLDASLFTGREPNQHRWDFNKPRFNSCAIRLSLQPTDNLTAQISTSFLKSPEQLEPKTNIYRTTASVIYNKTWNENQWQTTFAWGQNKKKPGCTLNGFLLESTLELQKKHVIFARIEHVAKDDLFIDSDPRAGTVFKVDKLDAGYVYELSVVPFITWQLGGVVSAAFVPNAIQSAYGHTPVSYMLFLRADVRE